MHYTPFNAMWLNMTEKDSTTCCVFRQTEDIILLNSETILRDFQGKIDKQMQVNYCGNRTPSGALGRHLPLKEEAFLAAPFRGKWPVRAERSSGREKPPKVEVLAWLCRCKKSKGELYG